MQRQQYYVIFNTIAGWVGLLGSAMGLKRTILPQSSKEQAIAALGIDTNKTVISQEHFKDLVKRFQDYFAGKLVDFPDKLDLNQATVFQRQVWETTRQIPYGQTRSYSRIARKIGSPGAARAVGQALGKNPLPIIIPCHRVVNSDGGPGGFSGGLRIKEQLLTLEKHSANNG